MVSSWPLELLEKGLDSYLVGLTRPFPDLVVCEFAGGWSAEGSVLGGLVCSAWPDQERVVGKSLVMRKLGTGGRSRRRGGV